MTVTVTDSDGDTSLPATTTAVVQGVGLLDGTLYVIGTPQADHVTINAQGTGLLKVHANFLLDSNFVTVNAADIHTILAYLCAGDDDMTIAGNIAIRAVLHGGDGNDRLNAGGMASVLLGGNGNDTLLGGSGGDILVGGLGQDQLVGGNDNDVLIGGATSEDEDNDALRAALDAWTSTADYATRVAAVDALLSVLDDGELDKLTGSAGRDLFYDGLGDSLTDIATKKARKRCCEHLPDRVSPATRSMSRETRQERGRMRGGEHRTRPVGKPREATGRS